MQLNSGGYMAGLSGLHELSAPDNCPRDFQSIAILFRKRSRLALETKESSGVAEESILAEKTTIRVASRSGIE